LKNALIDIANSNIGFTSSVTGMKLNDVVDIIKRRIFFIRTLTNDVEQEQFIPPTAQCTEWILVEGPAYGIGLLRK
jgi:hypothetical protein